METRQKSVLLVDDDEINRLVACKFLKRWNIDVTVATNGQEAVDLITADRKFQLVLMDLHMPEMDGYECTKIIRAMAGSYYAEVPIIAFSASSLMDSKQKAVEMGMTDCINKPLRFDELQEKVETYIKEDAPAPSDLRPLFVDWKLHTDGDVTFKSELISLLIDNVRELLDSLEASISQNDRPLFLKTCHKVATAINLLNDTELSTTLAAVNSAFKSDPASGLSTSKEKTLELQRIGQEIILSLKAFSDESQNRPAQP